MIRGRDNELRVIYEAGPTESPAVPLSGTKGDVSAKSESFAAVKKTNEPIQPKHSVNY